MPYVQGIKSSLCLFSLVPCPISYSCKFLPGWLVSKSVILLYANFICGSWVEAHSHHLAFLAIHTGPQPPDLYSGFLMYKRPRRAANREPSMPRQAHTKRVLEYSEIKPTLTLEDYS